MVNCDELPQGLRAIADAAGVETALRLALAKRGERIRIPRRAEGSVLADILGIDAARAIVKDLADAEIDVPMARRPLAFWLKNTQGWSVPKIAHHLGIARRTLQYWFSDTTPSRQGDLFDRAS